jgi:hypothetical protein
MTTATAARRRAHLTPVTDGYVPPAPADDLTAKADAEGANRLEQFAEDHDDACVAALVPEVVEQQRALIAKAMAAVATPGADLHAILLDYGHAMFVVGHTERALSDRELPGPSETEVGTLAAILRLEARR